MKFSITPRDKNALCRQAPEFSAYLPHLDLRGFECDQDLFHALTVSIVSQQLSLRAADAVIRKLARKLGALDPSRLLAAEPSELRECGLSFRKIEYLRGIAEEKNAGRLEYEVFASKTDSEAIEAFVRLKGVGVWTAEMLLIFSFGRPDVLSFRDLGIRRGLMMLNSWDDLTPERFERCRTRYSPYGTLASLCLWKIKDGGLNLS